MKNILLVCCTLVCSGLLQAQSSSPKTIVQASAAEVLNVIAQCPERVFKTPKGEIYKTRVNDAVEKLNDALTPKNGYYVSSVTKEVSVMSLEVYPPINKTTTVYLIKTAKGGEYGGPKPVSGITVNITQTIKISQPQGISNPMRTQELSCNLVK